MSGGDDDLDPARGVITTTLLGVAMWAVIGLAIAVLVWVIPQGPAL